MKKKSKKEEPNFIKSIKVNRRFFYSCMLDLLFYVVLTLIVISAMVLVKSYVNSLESIVPLLSQIGNSMQPGGVIPDDLANNIEDVSNMRLLMQSVLNKIIIIFILAYLAIIASSTAIRSLIWSNILKQKLSKTYFKKYFMLNIIWVVLWSALIYLATKITKIKVFWVIGVLFAVYLYFTVILRSLFDEKKNSISMVKQSFVIGAKKIHLVIFNLIPAIVAAAILAVLFRYAWFNLARIVTSVMIAVVSIVYFAWLRILVSGAVKTILPKLKKKH